MINLAEKLKMAPPVKLFRIGEIARFSGLSRQTIHNYTVMGLITEQQRSGGGHRLYEESVFHILARIEQLKQTMTLREIRLLLADEQQVLRQAVSG